MLLEETPLIDAWAYLAGSLLGVALWAAIFARRRDLRRRMLWVSLLLLPMAPLGESFFALDYWRPPLLLPIWYGGYEYGGLADFFFAFALGGIATAAYPLATRRAAPPGARPRRRWLALVFVGATIGSVFLLTQLGPVNSIFSCTLGFLLTAAAVCAVRRDLVAPALVSALASSATLVGVEALGSLLAPHFLAHSWLLLGTPWGILLFGRVPLTEALWGAAFGAAIGPLYDACTGAAAHPAAPPPEPKGTAPSGGESWTPRRAGPDRADPRPGVGRREGMVAALRPTSRRRQS